MAVFRATVPLGAPVENLPAPRNFIDELVFAKLKQIGMPPSPICDDATFLRRVTLDIAGRLPTAEEAQRVPRRARPQTSATGVIDALLASPTTPTSSPTSGRRCCATSARTRRDITANFAFHAWIRDSLLANKPYDQFVRELLAASGDVGRIRPSRGIAQ